MLPRRFFNDVFDDFMIQDKMMCDIYERDNKYFIEVEVPGLTKEDIKLSFSKGTIYISAEKNNDTEVNYLRRERKVYDKYERSIYLGDIDENNIEASFENGILTIIAPKLNSEDNKKYIEIK